jgi:hypothetical protein
MTQIVMGARHCVLIIGCVLVGGMLSPLLADDSATNAVPEKRYPYLKADVSAEFYVDAVLSADNPDAKGTDVYSSTELNAEVHVNNRFSIMSGLVIEPVDDRHPGQDRFFEDHGLYVEQLFGKLHVTAFDVFAGKFNPAFGRAWDDAPGIYGTDLAAGYELTERVGAGVLLERENTQIGTAKLQASVFHVDMSVFSHSAFTDRGPAYRLDGGLGDTGRMDSFAISLDGEKLPQLAGVSYNVGFVHQARGRNDSDDQNGFVAGAQLTRSANELELRWITEAAYFDYGGDVYAGGDPDLFVNELSYFTIGFEAKIRNFHAAAAYSAREATMVNGTHFDDWQYQISGGMDLGFDWSLDLGYKVLKEQGQESRVLGLMLIKTIQIDTPLSGAWLN